METSGAGLYLDTIALFAANDINNLIAGAADTSIGLREPAGPRGVRGRQQVRE